MSTPRCLHCSEPLAPGACVLVATEPRPAFAHPLCDGRSRRDAALVAGYSEHLDEFARAVRDSRRPEGIE